VVNALRQATAKESDIRVLGPAPAPLGKLRGDYRVQFLVKGGQRKRMREALQAVMAKRTELLRRTTVDIDPVSVL
jgi:primosomal protein N' (replication factor Y)